MPCSFGFRGDWPENTWTNRAKHLQNDEYTIQHRHQNGAKIKRKSTQHRVKIVPKSVKMEPNPNELFFTALCRSSWGPRPFWSCLGGVLEPFWSRPGSVFGVILGRLGAVLERLGAILGPLGAVFGRLEAVLEGQSRSRGRDGAG